MGVAYDLSEDSNGVTNQVTEKGPSEADRNSPYFCEFSVECVLHIGSQGDSIGMALISSPIIHRSMGVEGIDPGLSVFGRWRLAGNRESLRTEFAERQGSTATRLHSRRPRLPRPMGGAQPESLDRRLPSSPASYHVQQRSLSL